MKKKILPEKWESLTLTDGFIFAQVMKNPELCKTLLEKLLGLSIEKIEYIEDEKTIDLRYDSKGVRLDVYVKGSDAIYNLEIQRSDTYELPQRSRAYQSLIDLDSLLTGEDYKGIKGSYVVFICMEDIFKRGQYRYSFQNKCEEVDGLNLDDGTHKIFFNTKGTKGHIDPDIKAFLDYLEGEIVDNPFVKKLDEEVKKVKRSEHLKMQHAALFYRDRDNYRKGREEGREESIIKTIKHHEGFRCR